ncbi:MAG TPA: YqgE/AlgH family protein [Verrucomicrobiae bacterium]|jgi:putative transcriptional regulator|nr:YqgE/AlgH family protein [Verrucomicrobiae bacterium]
MAVEHTSLQGQLLLDGGKLQGSFFQRTVVLICQHDAEGAFGLVLNRAADSKVGEAIVANLPEEIKEQRLYIGGPVQPAALSFLHSNDFSPQPNVMMNITLGHSIEALTDLGDTFTPATKLRLFAGYAGWTAGQLDNEMARKDWLTHPASVDLIFDTDPTLLWRAILRQKGLKKRLLAESPEDLSWN